MLDEAPGQTAVDAPARPSVSSVLQLVDAALERGGSAVRLGALELPDRWPERWSVLADRFGLGHGEEELLLLALLPALDPQAVVALQLLDDDDGDGRVGPAVAARVLCHLPAWRLTALLLPWSPLRAGGLVHVGPSGRGDLLVDEQVVAFLLGRPGLPLVLSGALVTELPSDPRELAVDVARALVETGAVHLHEVHGAGGRALAATALDLLDRRAVVLDVDRVDAAAQLGVLRSAVLQARLRDAGLVVGPWESLAEPAAADACLLASGRLVLTHGAQGWEDGRSCRRPVELVVPPLDAAARRSLVEAVLEGWDHEQDEPLVLLAVDALAGLEAEQLTAALGAVLQGGASPSSAGRDLLEAARRVAERAVRGVARVVVSDERLDDVVAVPAVRRALRAVVDRARHRERVLDDWGLGDVVRTRRGTTALLTGPPGTGKTMSARAVAGELGRPLWVVDLSTVLDKYIGETEKRLERVFDAVDRASGVLLVDEADALFGKRGAVSDARDRFANSGVSYLLQRMEVFTGTLLLTTNMQGNLDEAFLRRLDEVIVLDLPDAHERRLLWQRHLVPGLPLGEAVDLDVLASLPLTGGDVRNSVVSAACVAAAGGGSVTTAMLVEAGQQELRKQGRLSFGA